jgi:hypothetical protein
MTRQDYVKRRPSRHRTSRCPRTMSSLHLPTFVFTILFASNIVNLLLIVFVHVSQRWLMIWLRVYVMANSDVIREWWAFFAVVYQQSKHLIDFWCDNEHWQHSVIKQQNYRLMELVYELCLYMSDYKNANTNSYRMCHRCYIDCGAKCWHYDSHRCIDKPYSWFK